MPYLTYQVNPIEHGLRSDYSRLHTPGGFAFWLTNGRVDQHMIKSRPGYKPDRNLYEGDEFNYITNVIPFQKSDNMLYNIYLTLKDAVVRLAGEGETFMFITDTDDISGAVSSISGATVTFVSNTVASDKARVGDKFILCDDHRPNKEVCPDWGTIKTVNVSGDYITSIVLEGNYTGTTGTFSTPKDCRIRHRYGLTPAQVNSRNIISVRWQWAVVNDKLCFTCPDENVKVWTATGYVSDLNSVHATRAKYCIEYANRLVLANLYIGGEPRPNTIKYSKENDPTNWTDNTAGEIDLLDSEDQITGLAKVGPCLVIFKPYSYSIWHRTGVATAPIARSLYRVGVGCIAPYSIAQIESTVAWLGKNDFYILDGDVAENIGEQVRYMFLELIPEAFRLWTWAGVDEQRNEVWWVAQANETKQYIFVWNWRYREWVIYELPEIISCFGRGIK